MKSAGGTGADSTPLSPRSPLNVNGAIVDGGPTSTPLTSPRHQPIPPTQARTPAPYAQAQSQWQKPQHHTPAAQDETSRNDEARPKQPKEKPQPQSQATGSTPVDSKAFYGYLFNSDKSLTDRLDGLLRAIGRYAALNLGDTNSPQLDPPKLAAFYRAVGGDYDSLFVSAPYKSISYIWRALGVQHSLHQPPDDDYAEPSIPVLTLRGFVRWQSLQILLGPEEHVPFMQYAARHWNLRDPDTGEAFPPDLPKEAFPAECDPDVDAWHKQCATKLKSAATSSNAGSTPQPSPGLSPGFTRFSAHATPSPSPGLSPDYASHHEPRSPGISRDPRVHAAYSHVRGPQPHSGPTSPRRPPEMDYFHRQSQSSRPPFFTHIPNMPRYAGKHVPMPSPHTMAPPPPPPPHHRRADSTSSEEAPRRRSFSDMPSPAKPQYAYTKPSHSSKQHDESPRRAQSQPKMYVEVDSDSSTSDAESEPGNRNVRVPMKPPTFIHLQPPPASSFRRGPGPIPKSAHQPSPETPSSPPAAAAAPAPAPAPPPPPPPHSSTAPPPASSSFRSSRRSIPSEIKQRLTAFLPAGLTNPPRGNQSSRSPSTHRRSSSREPSSRTSRYERDRDHPSSRRRSSSREHSGRSRPGTGARYGPPSSSRRPRGRATRLHDDDDDSESGSSLSDIGSSDEDRSSDDDIDADNPLSSPNKTPLSAKGTDAARERDRALRRRERELDREIRNRERDLRERERGRAGGSGKHHTSSSNNNSSGSIPQQHHLRKDDGRPAMHSRHASTATGHTSDPAERRSLDKDRSSTRDRDRDGRGRNRPADEREAREREREREWRRRKDRERDRGPGSPGIVTGVSGRRYAS